MCLLEIDEYDVGGLFVDIYSIYESLEEDFPDKEFLFIKKSNDIKIFELQEKIINKMSHDDVVDGETIKFDILTEYNKRQISDLENNSIEDIKSYEDLSSIEHKVFNYVCTDVENNQNLVLPGVLTEIARTFKREGLFPRLIIDGKGQFVPEGGEIDDRVIYLCSRDVVLDNSNPTYLKKNADYRRLLSYYDKYYGNNLYITTKDKNRLIANENKGRKKYGDFFKEQLVNIVLQDIWGIIEYEDEISETIGVKEELYGQEREVRRNRMVYDIVKGAIEELYSSKDKIPTIVDLRDKVIAEVSKEYDQVRGEHKDLLLDHSIDLINYVLRSGYYYYHGFEYDEKYDKGTEEENREVLDSDILSHRDYILGEDEEFDDLSRRRGFDRREENIVYQDQNDKLVDVEGGKDNSTDTVADSVNKPAERIIPKKHHKSDQKIHTAKEKYSDVVMFGGAVLLSLIGFIAGIGAANLAITTISAISTMVSLPFFGHSLKTYYQDDSKEKSKDDITKLSSDQHAKGFEMSHNWRESVTKEKEKLIMEVNSPEVH